MHPLINGCGVYRNLPGEEYYSLPYLSASAIKACHGNTKKLAYSPEAKQVTTEAMKFGTAFHTYVLERDNFKKDYEVVPVGTSLVTTEGRKAKKKAKEQGKQIFKGELANTIVDMVDSMRNHPWLFKNFGVRDRDVEISLVSEVYGVKLKSRLDTYRQGDGLVIDLKTTQDASPEAWRKEILYRGGLTQAAVYMKQLEIQGLPANTFVFAAVEKEPPHVCGIYQVAKADIEQRWREVKELLKRFSQEREQGGTHYTDGPMMITSSVEV